MTLNSKLKIGIVDYGLGNIFSILQAFKKIGAQTETFKESARFKDFDGIVLPGVGAFGKAMDDLRQLDLKSEFIEHAKSGKPAFGICLGLQLIMSESFEFGRHKGLDLVEGTVEKFPQSLNSHELRVPFVGWNTIIPSTDSPVVHRGFLQGILPVDEFYFVHSFYARPRDDRHVLAYADYAGFKYPAIIQRDNVIATQFHPEKSAEQGLKLFANWLETFRRS